MPLHLVISAVIHLPDVVVIAISFGTFLIKHLVILFVFPHLYFLLPFIFFLRKMLEGSIFLKIVDQSHAKQFLGCVVMKGSSKMVVSVLIVNILVLCATKGRRMRVHN